MRFTDRVASLSPAVVTIVFIALLVSSAATTLPFPIGSQTWALAYSVSMAWLMAPILLWHYSIYRAASDRSAAFVGHGGRRGFLFALCAITLTTFLISFPIWMLTPVDQPASKHLATANTAAMLISCVCCFLAIWASANALTRFDEQSKRVDLHKVLGTFVLQFYAPIGVWVIHRRIRNVTNTPLPA